MRRSNKGGASRRTRLGRVRLTIAEGAVAEPDLYDISHNNEILNWDDVAEIPIVHKVNEGTALDTKFRERIDRISQRTEIFGGYTVLIISASSIRKQIETYVRKIEKFWRDGAFTQLDVEPWAIYPRPVNVDEVEEAQAV